MRRGIEPAADRTAQRGTAPALTGAALGLLVALAATPAAAVEPDEMLEDPALEERARVISRDLRCVVCQNESIDESNADMARDMRILVRDRLLEGDSNAEVKQYLVDRYGDYVLLTPPFKPTTYVLWFGPALILVGAAVAAVAYYRHKAKAPAAPPPLTAEEQAQLRSLLAMHGDDTGTSSKPDPKTPKARSKTPRRGGSA